MTQGGMYNWRVKSVLDALARQGKAEGPLTVEDLVGLGHLDQYHYLGVTACDHVIELLGLESGRTVLDIGSGIGGPARYLAATTGCSVLGIEIQSALCEAATELTSRAGLGERVKYITADAAAMQEVVLPAPFQPHGEGFDHFISQLVNLHVPDRSALLGSVYTRLRPGATFVIEDFCESAPLLNSERQLLVDVVKAQSITTTASYVAELESVGFVDVEMEDMSAQWKTWTAARYEAFLASEAESVAIYGRAMFEERSRFYGAVAKLYQGGRLGGVILTGRKPCKLETALRTARRRMGVNGRGATQDEATRILESGATYSTSSHVANGTANSPLANGTAAAPASKHAQLVGSSSVQPALPWTSEARAGLHDSLQYHFFLPSLFVAIRVFHTASLQSITAWAYDLSQQSHGEPIELVNTYVPLKPVGTGHPALHLANEELGIADGADGITIRLSPSSAAASALLKDAGVGSGPSGRPQLVLEATQGHAYEWVPVGAEEDLVIHRPSMTATLLGGWRGVDQSGYGYSKRYHGIYARYNGWRFIHGVATPSGAIPSPLDSTPPATVWTADATFGDRKYNYYKLLLPSAHASGELVEAAAKDTYNQQDAGYATIGGVSHVASIEEIAKWHTVIGGGGDGHPMEAKYENRLCNLTLVQGDQMTKGIAYNERYLGTLW